LNWDFPPFKGWIRKGNIIFTLSLTLSHKGRGNISSINRATTDYYGKIN